jgi:metal-responsive CopG/Arc/MetJ family transcriptional regulator
MSIVRRKAKMRRTQISLPNEQYEAVRRVAARRGVSLSQVFRDSVRSIEEQDEQEHRDYVRRMMRIVGIVKDGDPNASVDHDTILYEHGDQQ